MMSARTLDPLVLGCSRRRARRLARAMRRQPFAFILNTRILEWLARTRTPLTPALAAAFRHAAAFYAPALWTDNELRELSAAAGRGVSLETIALWALLRGEGDLDICLRHVPGPVFPFPEALALAHAGTWKWPARYAVEEAWRLAPRQGALLADPAFLALESRLQLWLLEIADAHGGDVAALIPWADDSISSSFLARLPLAAAVDLLQRYARLRPIEQTGLQLAGELGRAEMAEAIAALPPAALTRIAKARRNRQLWWEVKMALRQVPAGLTVAALATRPELLFELGMRLHAFGAVRAKAMLRRMAGLALFAPDPRLEANPDGLVALDRMLTEHRELARTIPAFATWELHFSGERPLGRLAIEQTGAQILEALPGVRVRFLMAQVDAAMAVCGDAHAGLLLAGLQTGRHALRRFLRAHQAGQDPRLELPANRRWLAARPEFALSTWLRPLRITLPVAGLGEVTLEAESDPFELLRLGTYARSCLAPGGVNSGNAVAVLLDVNKRAVYARNANGRFLARQIVAVSDDGHLLGYPVYPDGTAAALEDFFQLYFEDWAMQLGLPVGRGCGHAVSPLTVADWYEDWRWSRLEG